MNKRLTLMSLVLTGTLVTPLLNSTTAVVASAPSCRAGQLHLSMGRAQGAAGSTIYNLRFTNVGPTCTLFGVPSLQPVAGNPLHHVGPVSMNESRGEMAALHTLTKGQSAVSAVSFTETGNFPVARCHPASITGVLVTLGDAAVTFVAHRFVPQVQSVCTTVPSVGATLLS